MSDRRLQQKVIMYNYAGEEGKLSLTGLQVTEVNGYAKVMSGGSYGQYEHNLKAVKYQQDISAETWCVLCPTQCHATAAPQVDLVKCPAIKGNITLSNIKAYPISQAEWDRRFGAPPWYTQWWGILLIALAVVMCGGCLVGMFMYSRRTRTKRSVDQSAFESGMTSGTMDSQQSEDLLEQELLHPGDPDGYAIGGLHDVGDQRLPFPEAGLPNSQQLPFPEAGLGQEHAWANQQAQMSAGMAARQIRR